MRASYNRLWKLLIDKKMSKTDLRHSTKISTSTLAKLGKDEMVSTEVLSKICNVLNCSIGDIIDMVKDENEQFETIEKEGNYKVISLFSGAG